MCFLVVIDCLIYLYSKVLVRILYNCVKILKLHFCIFVCCRITLVQTSHARFIPLIWIFTGFYCTQESGGNITVLIKNARNKKWIFWFFMSNREAMPTASSFVIIINLKNAYMWRIVNETQNMYMNISGH